MKHLLHLLLFLLPLTSFSQVLVRDVFDFAVGDTFQRKINNPGGQKYISEIVTNRQNYYPDSIVYTFATITDYGYPYNIETSSGTARITKIDTPILMYQSNNACSNCTIDVQYTVSHIGQPNYVTEYSYTGYYTSGYCEGATNTTGELWMGLGLGTTYRYTLTILPCGTTTGERNELFFYRKATGETYGEPHRSLYTSINNLHTDVATVSLTPNPSSGHFTLTLSQQPNRNTTLRLYNLTGQLLNTHLLQNEATNIDVSTLPKGIYMWQLEEDGKTIQNGKLITQ